MRASWLVLPLLVACAKAAPVETAAEPPPVAPLAGCDGPPTWPLGDVLLEPRPLWAAKYAKTREIQGPFLAIDAVMRTYDLDRGQAVEVQNQVRDAFRADPQADGDAVLDAALTAVRAGEHESGLDPAEAAAAEFIVVFDLDETLYDQRWDDEAVGASCGDLTGTGGGAKHIKRAPGWQTVFATVQGLGGKVAIFSAHLDEVTLGNTAPWTWEGTPLLDHPDVLGIFSNSYLVMQDKDATLPSGAKDRSGPVVEPSKDLRILDESLTRVILVDDNPTRVFQPRNLRTTQKFDGDRWCAGSTPPEERRMLANELVAVSDEIREAVTWWRAHEGTTFVDAYLPYTWLGQVTVDALIATHGWSRDEAIAYLRTHPDAAPHHF